MRSTSILFLSALLLSGCAGPTAEPDREEFATNRQHTIWKAMERNTIETPPALIGLWRSKQTHIVMELELNADGTYRRGQERSFRPWPDQEWRSGYEAGAYRVVADGTIVFNAQSGADGFPGHRQYHRLYQRSFTLKDGRLELSEADYLGTIQSVTLHPNRATFTPLVSLK